MTYQTLLVSLEKNILTLSLNRPDLRNAFNALLIQELTQAFAQASTQEEVRLVVLKGEGKAFCAGGDLNWMKESALFTEEQNIADAKKLSTLLTTINNCPKPVIGLTHGGVFGGGVGLVSVCDHVIATQETLFSFSEVRLGLIPAVIGPFVRNKIGESATRSLFLSADRFTAQRALEIGLIHQVVAHGEEMTKELTRLAGNFLAGSPQALRVAKSFLAQLPPLSLQEQNQLAAKTLAQIRVSEEGQEGIKAFLEKRPPRWIPS